MIKVGILEIDQFRQIQHLLAIYQQIKDYYAREHVDSMQVGEKLDLPAYINKKTEIIL